MRDTLMPNGNYDVSHDGFYASFENASGLKTNHVAYEVVGDVAYTSINATFKDANTVRVCDMGCFLGGSSARWHRHGKGVARVLGVDIHESNILIAQKTYGDVEGLSFQHIAKNDALPLIDAQRYHVIFATFVLDTIHCFEDAKQLCHNMVNALLIGGEIYLLRLHPASLSFAGQFHEYRFQSKATWTHGDPLLVQLVKDDEAILIDDRFWSPQKIADTFHLLECDVDLIPVSYKAPPLVVQSLNAQVEKHGLSQDMPEWTVPLYQIIRVKKR